MGERTREIERSKGVGKVRGRERSAGCRCRSRIVRGMLTVVAAFALYCNFHAEMTGRGQRARVLGRRRMGQDRPMRRRASALGAGRH